MRVLIFDVTWERAPKRLMSALPPIMREFSLLAWWKDRNGRLKMKVERGVKWIHKISSSCRSTKTIVKGKDNDLLMS